jgi:hypothetical protein
VRKLDSSSTINTLDERMNLPSWSVSSKDGHPAGDRL